MLLEITPKQSRSWMVLATLAKKTHETQARRPQYWFVGGMTFEIAQNQICSTAVLATPDLNTQDTQARRLQFLWFGHLISIRRMFVRDRLYSAE